MADGDVKQSVIVKPLAGHIGAEIRGLDLGQELSDVQVAEVRKALLRWKVVFFRNQDIDNAAQVRFAARFGEVTYAHPLEDEPVDASFPQVLAIDRRRYERKDGRRYKRTALHVREPLAHRRDRGRQPARWVHSQGH